MEHVYTHIHICIQMHVCVHIWKVAFGGPPTLSLLWMLRGLSHYELLTDQPDYTLPLCVRLRTPTQCSQPLAASEQTPRGNEYGFERTEPGGECDRTEWLHHQWLPRLMPSLTEESKGSMNFVLTFLDLHCAWKGLRDKLLIVFVCNQNHRPRGKA